MANRYWVGGSADWDVTAGTKWALTSGGAGGQAVPTSADDVFFDLASGAVTVRQVANQQCNNLDFSGFTGIFSNFGTPILNISGSFTLGIGMTNNFTGEFRLIATTTGHTITTNGIPIKGFDGLYIKGIGGGWTCQDDIEFSYAGGTALAMYDGVLDCNNKNFNFTGAGASFDAFSATLQSKVLMGTGTWTFNGSSSQWFDNSNINYIDGSNATIVFNGSATGPTNYCYLLNAQRIKNVIINPSSSGFYFKILGSLGGCIIDNLYIKRGVDIEFDANYTFQILSSITQTGTSSSYTILHNNSSSPDAPAYLRYLGGDSIALDHIQVRGLYANYLKDDKYSISSITCSPNSLTGAATTLVLGDDTTSSINIGFTFNFFDADFTTLWVSSNGVLGLSASTGSRNQPYAIPTKLNTNGFIAGFWKDLNPAAGGTIKYETQGVAPNRVLIVDFNGVYEFATTSPCTFQFKLYETTNIVEIHSTSCTNTNNSYIVQQGMESPDGQTGTFSNDRNATYFSLTNDAVRYTPSTTTRSHVDWNLSISDDLGRNNGFIFVDRNNFPLKTGTIADNISRGPAVRTEDHGTNAPAVRPKYL